MLRGGQALEELGDEVEYLFALDILGERTPLRFRRVIVPLAVCLRVWQKARSSEIDVVELHEHLAAPYAVLVTLPWARRMLPPCVVLCHGLVERQCRIAWEEVARSARTIRWLRWWSIQLTLIRPARLAHRYASGVLVMNQEDRTQLVHSEGLEKERVSVVTNGVDPDILALEREPAEELRVLFLGTWLARKGVHELVAAWRMVTAERSDLSLTLAGTVLSQDEVLQTFAGCRDGPRVVPHVSRPDLPELLRAHDVLVMPSRSEGMPLAALEAAGAGLAVVASRIPGLIDIFRAPHPERDGAILISRCQAQELASVIHLLAEDRSLVQSLGESARRRGSELTWGAAAAGLHDAYAKALGDPAEVASTE